MQIHKIAGIAVVVLALASCSSDHKSTVATSEGTVTTDTSSDANTTTITTQNGTMKAGATAVDPASLGLPVYPGASIAEGGGWSIQSKDGGGQIVTLTTPDSFDAVESWYKSKMPANSEAMNMKSGDTASAIFKVGKDSESDQSTVMINGEKDKTTITLTHQKKGS